MELMIQEHMYRTLFEEKDVSCRRDLYLRFYPVLWPCEDAFRDFLTERDPSLQLSATKAIYACIGQEETVFFPKFTWKCLIRLQQERLVDKPRGCIPQDHVVHATNLYILGIYAFFNLPIIQRKILHACSGSCTEAERILRFIEKWKLFSFYHDIGYVFESLTSAGEADTPQAFSEYLKLREHILSECVSRSISRLIVATTLVQRCGANFYLDENTLIGVKWIDEAGEPWTPETLCEMLKECRNYRLLEDVQSMKGFRQLSPFLSHVKYLAVVENQQNGLLAFFKRESNGETQLVYNYNAGLTKNILWAITDSIPLHFEGMSVHYYLCEEDFWHNLLGQSGTYQAFEKEARKFNEFMPETYRQQFSLICDDSDIGQIFRDIASWHHANWPWESGMDTDSNETFDQYRQVIGDCLSKALGERVCLETQMALKQTDLTVENLKEAIESLGETIKAISVSEIQKVAIQHYEKRGVPSEIFRFSNRLYGNLLRELGGGKASPYIQIEHQVISVRPFSLDNGSAFSEALYNQMEKLASALGLRMETLKAYRPDHSLYDHGVLSAALLFQTLAVFYDLSEATAEHFPIEPAWNGLKIHEMARTESIQSYADVVFAILIHNVYTRNAKPEYGLQYQQNIDKNPFSYFCTLMDSLQKWSRPKQIDFSAMDLPEDHYLGNDFDINVSKGRLRIICHSNRTGMMRKQLEDAEDYLPGILSLVCITEEER